MRLLLEVVEGLDPRLAALPAASLAGAALAVGSSCNWPAVAAMAGYAGSRTGFRAGHAVVGGLGFMAGTLVCLTALDALAGAAAGWMSGLPIVAGKIAVGLASIFFGLAALDLVPFKLPSFRLPVFERREGLLGLGLLGFLLGALSMGTTGACCGPLLPVAFGLVIAKEKLHLGPSLLAAFSFGYSLPAALAVSGVGLGSGARALGRLGPRVHQVFAVLLILSGFWMLVSL